MQTLTALFKSLGVSAPKNIRTGWSSRSDRCVVLTLWSHHIVSDGKEYRDDNRGAAELGVGSFADKKRREHIAYAVEHLHGEVRSIIVTQKSGSHMGAIQSQKIGPDWRVTMFDAKSGAFRLERITFANRRRISPGKPAPAFLRSLRAR